MLSATNTVLRVSTSQRNQNIKYLFFFSLSFFFKLQFYTPGRFLCWNNPSQYLFQSITMHKSFCFHKPPKFSFKSFCVEMKRRNWVTESKSGSWKCLISYLKKLKRRDSGGGDGGGDTAEMKRQKIPTKRNEARVHGEKVGCLPGRTPGPRGKEASPEKAPLSRSLGTTCLWLHKTAIPK